MHVHTSRSFAGAFLVASAVLAGCAESSDTTAPTGFPLRPSLAVGDLVVDATPEFGILKVCKLGNIDATFDVTGVSVAGGSFEVAGLGADVATGECRILAEGFADVSGTGGSITLTENPAVALVSITGEKIDLGSGGPAAITPDPVNGGTYFLNNFHGFTITFTNETPPEDGCTLTQGYWKTHGGTGPQGNAWPVNNLTLGSVNYTQAQLIAILKTPVKGNGLISLAHQLIAAKLNIANGASAPADVLTAIANADALIGGLVVPPVGGGSLSTAATAALTGALDDYNNGVTGPGHCDNDTAQN